MNEDGALGKHSKGGEAQMKNILHLFKRDVQNVSRSVIGMVVVMGLIIVPVPGLTSPAAGTRT